MDAGPHLLVLAIASEVASLAGPIAAATSVVNALASPDRPTVREDTLRPCLPPEPMVYPALLPRLAVMGLSPAVFDEIQHFHVRLGHARRAALAFTASSAEATFKGGVHLDVLAGGWRDLCEATTGLLDLLAHHADTGHSARWAAGLSRSDAMLGRAAFGEWPCVLADGSVEVPGLAERRRHDRYCVAWSASMLRGGAMLAVRIDNVSVRGLGISSDVAVYIDEPVIVQLMGRMLSGHVIWTTARRFGVRLAVPLSATDPIIASARAA